MNTMIAALLATTILTGALSGAADIARRSRADAHSDPIMGAWDEQVTLKDCASGAVLNTFRVSNLFIEGGALIATNTLPPTAGSPALGTWSRSADGKSVQASIRFFRYAKDGSFAGVQQIERTLRIDASGNAMSGKVVTRTYDVDGVLVQSGCSTETGERSG